MGRGDFLVADGNLEAVSWIDRWPDWPVPAFTLYGPAASGKSHLAQVWRERVREGGGKAVSLLPETLAGADVLEHISDARWIVLEDADRYVPFDRDREVAVFHIYNTLNQTGGHMLLTAREAPSRWPLALPDLRSRLVGAPAARIDPPDDALMAAVLVKHFSDRQVRVPPDVIQYLLRRIERSFPALRQVAAALDAAALAKGGAITVPLAGKVLSELNIDQLSE